jgi:hypothetical protein
MRAGILLRLSSQSVRDWRNLFTRPLVPSILILTTAFAIRLDPSLT